MVNPRIPEIHDIEIFCGVREDKQASSWQFSTENSAFRLEIANGKAVFSFKYPLSSFEEAERSVKEFLHSWEGDLLLQTGPLRRDFTISGCRAPGYGGRAYAYGHATVGGALAEANTRVQSPWRRHRYWHIPLLNSLIARYESYRIGREQLTVLGYLCLSALNSTFGNQKKLGERLQIDRKVLRELGRLVSTVGTIGSARKIDGKHHELRDLTASEVYWLETVIRELLLRAGEDFDARPITSRLSLKNLPSL